MRNILNNFLLSVLWLTAVTLGATFWFGARFGFALLSRAHWTYLGTAQATQTPIATSFYISMIVIAIIAISGLYLIVRPRPRKIALGGNVFSDTKPEPLLQITHQSLPKINQQSAIINQQSSARPPRLVLPKIIQQPTQANNQPPTRTTNTNTNHDDIEQIFRDTGYIVKPAPRIAGLRPALFAIGADETLWVGADVADSEKLTTVVERLRALFVETLEDITINIRSFTIGAGGEFADADALREYLTQNPNRQLTDSETDDFNAYSEYIDTVANYFNKL